MVPSLQQRRVIQNGCEHCVGNYSNEWCYREVCLLLYFHGPPRQTNMSKISSMVCHERNGLFHTRKGDLRPESSSVGSRCICTHHTTELLAPFRQHLAEFVKITPREDCLPAACCINNLRNTIPVCTILVALLLSISRGLIFSLLTIIAHLCFPLPSLSLATPSAFPFL